MSRFVGVIGSRSLPASFSPLVASVVSLFLGQGFGVASGGALGADSFALSALIRLHGACPERAIASPRVVSALLGRNQRLVSACSVLVAFLFGPSRGSLYTVRQAVARGIPVVVFLCGDGASLPTDLSSRCFVFNI